MRTDRTWLLVIASLLAACRGPDLGRFPEWLSPCERGGSDHALCGSFPVWENRELGAGRRIDLNVVVLPADAPAPREPIFYLEGGPGGAATEALPFAAWVLEPLRARHDLVFVDQRGTGRSSPLDCEHPSPVGPLQASFEEMLPVDLVRRCREALHQPEHGGADVRRYTTPIAMDDLDEVRGALGYERIDLMGISYGTRAGLVFLRRHPERVRSAVLKGVASTDMENPLPFARALESAMAALVAACRDEAACHRAYPELDADWRALPSLFDAGPVQVELARPAGGRAEQVWVSRGVFADGLRHLLYSVRESASVPGIVHAAAHGDLRPFAERELRQSAGFDRALAAGAFLTVTCAEDVRFIDDDEVAAATAGTLLGDYRVRRQRAACAEWPPGVGVDAAYQEPVRVDVPVLLLSGELDPATPASGGERVARSLPRGRYLLVPNESHDFAEPSCERQLIARFFETGGTGGLDAGCLAATRRPAFERGNDRGTDGANGPVP